MRTLKLVLILLFFNCSYGQVYEFDKIIKYKFSSKILPNQEMTNLFNTHDYSYHMQIYIQNDTLKTRIFDDKTNQVHLFYVIKADSMSLKYNKTKSFDNSLENQSYEFSEVKVKNNQNIIKLTILNQKKRKIAKYKLTIEDDAKDLFTAFKLSGAIHPFEPLNIFPPHNFKVLKSEGINENGYFIKYELLSIQDIKISVVVP